MKYLSPTDIINNYPKLTKRYNLTAQSIGWLVRMRLINGVSSKNCYLIDVNSFIDFFDNVILNEIQQLSNCKIKK